MIYFFVLRGECGYCIKSLNLPFIGSLFLENKESKITFSVNMTENSEKIKVSEIK